jgi:acyl-CoA dehydrogenase
LGTITAGISIGRRHFPLNSAFQNGPNWGVDVFIPIDWVIGGAEQVGQGWKMLMQCCISMPSLITRRMPSVNWYFMMAEITEGL